MKYYSEHTKKIYDTIEDLEAAEVELKAKADAEAKKNEERKLRAKEIEVAHQAVIDAQKHERALIDAFVKDYKSYHMTYSNVEDAVNDAFNGFFKFW